MLPQTENACIQRAEGAFPYSATADTEMERSGIEVAGRSLFKRAPFRCSATADTEMERSGIEVAGRSESTKYKPKTTITF